MTAPEVRRRPSRPEVRERVLQAAGTVFAERGFEGASVDLVAAAAGFTKGAVYSNFATKDELFLELMDSQVQRRLDRVVRLLADATDNEDLARLVGELLARASLDDPEWQQLFLAFWQRAMRDAKFRAEFVRHRRALRKEIASAVEQVMRTWQAESAFTAEQLSLLLLALSNGLALEGLVDPDCDAAALFGPVLELLVRRQELPTAPGAAAAE